MTELQEQLTGPKPVSAAISAHDVQALYACGTDPNQFRQLILAKLLDAGCPAVEGKLTLKLTHGAVFKLRDSMLEAQTEFCYIWLPPAYVYSMSAEMRQGALA